MKILRVASDLYPSVVGGVGLHAHEMSKWQAKMGHDVTVYTSNIDGRPQQEQLDGYEVVRFKPIVKSLGNAIMPNMLPELLKNEKEFDVIHAHSHLFFSTNLCSLVRKIKSTPLVITNHGLISQTAPQWVQMLYLPTVAKWTYDAADRVICYTEEDKLMLEDLGVDHSKIAVIHNGIDTDLFSPGGKGKNKEWKQILWVGRFTPGKGVEYLIDAFKMLLDDFPEAKLVMVGRGPMREVIEEKTVGLSNVSIQDFVPNSELPNLYRDSDVFVLPSLYEGFPRTIMEAMACGVPIVCTDLPQFAEIVNDCGLVVPVGDSRGLASSIGEILSGESLSKRLGENGRKTAVKNYSWEDTVRKTINVYRD